MASAFSISQMEAPPSHLRFQDITLCLGRGICLVNSIDRRQQDFCSGPKCPPVMLEKGNIFNSLFACKLLNHPLHSNWPSSKVKKVPSSSSLKEKALISPFAIPHLSCHLFCSAIHVSLKIKESFKEIASIDGTWWVSCPSLRLPLSVQTCCSFLLDRKVGGPYQACAT